MLNTLLGLYLSDKHSLRSDRIIWSETVESSSVSSVQLENAINGSSLKNELGSFDFIATSYTLWTSNGIVSVEIKPDDENTNRIKTDALTQKTSSVLIPPKVILADITINLTNNQSIQDDVFIVIDIIKAPHGKIPLLLDLGESLAVSPDNIDIQTLSIQKQLINSNIYLSYIAELIKALIISSGGKLPDAPQTEDYSFQQQRLSETSCRRRL